MEENNNNKINSKIRDLAFDDLKKPAAIIKAQHEEKEEQNHVSKVNLFFSFDIVNSTMYKSLTGNWPIIIKGLLEDIKSQVFRVPELSSSILWRVIGDEMIFVLVINSDKEIQSVVNSIFEVLQKTSRSLKTGRFFESLEGQSLQKNDIAMLKTQTPLSIKAAAWLAVVNNKLESPHECIKFTYTASSKNQSITEYLGRDIDAGFRLKSYTQDRRLIVSFELAYLLDSLKKESSEKDENLFIIDYIRLKGVWSDALYPIIWFHDAKIAKNTYQDPDRNDEDFKFSNSFRYDETDNNDLVNKYFKRTTQSEKIREVNSEYLLANDMYEINSALKKIVLDRNFETKISYIKQILSTGLVKSTPVTYPEPLEMHCAVVCCNVKEKKIMITHRGNNHITNPQKWEFGCAKLTSEENMVKTITTHYKSKFDLDIELIIASNREEKQPVPIAVYELPNQGNIKKGVIFVAKVNNPPEPKNFRAEKSHDEIKWISEAEIDAYKKDAVSDFEQTARKVFENFEIYFLHSS